MKIKIIELLEMINDGKAPQKILYEDEVYEYKEADYQNEDGEILFSTLFSNYSVNYILNEYVVILETTITYKPDKVEKLEIIKGDIKIEEVGIVALNLAEENRHKINEIIDYINKESDKQC